MFLFLTIVLVFWFEKLIGVFLGRHMYGRPNNSLIDPEDADDEPLSSFFIFCFFLFVFFIFFNVFLHAQAS